MARKGGFSRRRSQSSNLTLLIAALIREQRAAEDRAIFDAYQNGGLFQGKPVDDKRLLGYITTRRNGFGTGDPLYDQWNNTLIQTTFSIGEQKIALAFKQGKASASDVARFYSGQLANIAKDSAFYREVAGRAAEWAKSAAAAGRAAAGTKLKKQIEAAQKVAFDTFNAYSALEAEITRIAQREGLIGGNQSVLDAKADALADLLDGGAVVGADGTPITYAEWQQATIAAYNTVGTVITLGEQAGYDYKEWRNTKDKLWNHVTEINAVDDRALYEEARATFIADQDAAGGDPYATDKAVQKYRAALAHIALVAGAAGAGTATDENQSDFIGALNNEIDILDGKATGGFTAADLFGNSPQLSRGEGTKGLSDADFLTNAAAQLKADIEALDKGSAYLGQQTPGGDIAVIPFLPGQQNSPLGNNGLGPETQLAITEVNGVDRPVYLVGQAITAQSYVDLNGRPVAADQVTIEDIRLGTVALSKDSPVVGYIFADPGGQITYGIVDPTNGSVSFTEANPFSLTYIDGAPVVVVDGTLNNKTGEVSPNLGLAISNVPSAVTPFIAGTGVSNGEILKLIDDGVLTTTPERADALRAQIARQQQKDRALAQFRQEERTGVSPIQPYSPLSALPEGIRNVGTSLKSLFDSVSAFSPTQGFSPDDRPPTIAPKTDPFGGTVAPPPTSAPLTSGLVSSPSAPDPTLTPEDFAPPPPPSGTTGSLIRNVSNIPL